MENTKGMLIVSCSNIVELRAYKNTYMRSGSITREQGCSKVGIASVEIGNKHAGQSG